MFLPVPLKRFIAWGAIILFFFSGIRLLSAPTHEITYDAQPPTRLCHDAGCSVIYRFIVGNTGWKPVNDIILTFNGIILDDAALPLKAMNFGKTRRKIVQERSEDKIKVSLGTLKPQDRVDVDFMLLLSPAETPPNWSEVLHEIKPDQGELVRGSPEMVMFGRFLIKFLT